MNKLNVIIDKFSNRRMKTRVKEILDLPVMPPIVSEILKLKASGNYDKKKLLNLISKDPVLSAQVIKWANAPYYGKNKITTSINDAIDDVLGLELAMNICIGIAIGEIVNIPVKGILGLKQFWKHTLYVAALTEQLAAIIAKDKKVNKNLAYLCGLLHDIGFLVLGQIFPPQYSLLSQAAELNKDEKIVKLENHILNVSHQSLGVWLMDAWKMPNEIKVVVEHHHNPEYSGEHVIYANIVFIADSVIKRVELGLNLENVDLPQSMLSLLGIDKMQIQHALNVVLKNTESLDTLINTLK